MKEAVVFVLDANSSMGQLMDGEKLSRFDVSKTAVVSMISELMLQSVTNEVAVILTKTPTTQHHQMAASEEFNEDVPFPNLTELTPGIIRPTVDLLRRIEGLAVTADSKGLRGDLCDGIVLAADAHYERGTRYKFQRKIVVLTDAQHDLYMNISQMCEVVDALRDMECTLQVIGLDFDQTGVYSHPIAASSAIKIEPEAVASTPNLPSKKIKMEHDDDIVPETLSGIKQEDISIKQEDMLVKEEDNDDQDETFNYANKHDREQLLLSLTEKTGGEVLSIQNLQQLLEINRGRRIPRSTKFKFDLHVGPNLVLNARHFLLLKKCDIPTLKREAVWADDDGNPLLDEYGKERADKFERKILYVDEDHPDEIVDEYTMAVLFGSSLVPMSTFDYEGLKTTSGARIEILGYLERSKIPLSYISGPPSGITGHDSVTSCAGIAALSRALALEDKVGIGTFYKSSRSAEPILVAIYPFENRLLTLQIPFEGDVRNLDLQPLPEEEPDKAQVCDNLIDSLMLDENVLQSGTIPSPFYRSWHQTKLQRALHPDSTDVVQTRDESLLSIPKDVLERAERHLEAFALTFPLEKVKEKKAVTKTAGKRVITHKDFL